MNIRNRRLYNLMSDEWNILMWEGIQSNENILGFVGLEAS